MSKVYLLLGIFIASFSLLVSGQESLSGEEVALSFPGKHQIGMRTRYQDVNDTWLGDGEAFTTRLKFTSHFTFDEDEQWLLLSELNYVYAFNEDDFNSVTVKKSTSPIPDPPGLNLTQMFLNYKSSAQWQVKLGRQSIAFDNERMIGTIEFWQTPQSFSALSFDYNDQINWHVQYVYTNKVHRIFGHNAKLSLPRDDIRYNNIEQRPLNELGEHKLNGHLLNINHTTEDNLNISAYSYLLENYTQSQFSSNTFGLRIMDEFKPNRFKYRYSAEFAWQENAYNNPERYHAWYNLLEASVQYKSHLLKASQEIISENNHQGFKTPLGTNHKFQGWADVFTGYAMQTGLRDQYITYKGRYKKLRWRLVYHKFGDFNNKVNIGNEFDFELAYRLTRKWEFKFIFADYRTKEGLNYFPKANFDLSTWFASVAYNI